MLPRNGTYTAEAKLSVISAVCSGEDFPAKELFEIRNNQEPSK